MANDIPQAVRAVCLWLPEAEEVVSHGSPNFRVRGKTFATYVVNHHGDGRVALWLNVLPGAQELHVGTQPRHFFVPPYVGPRGWLGVLLDKGLAWKRIAALVREAYEKVAPEELRKQLGKTPLPKTPKPLALHEIDPFKAPRVAAQLKKLGKLCLAYPETFTGSQFGHPAWVVGKKTFVIARFEASRLTLCFWVGVEAQGLLVEDPRYRIPPYLGHNGWISLDTHEGIDWHEVANLIRQSYRHFALKRMLRLIGEL